MNEEQQRQMLGARIRHLRERSGLSQGELARKANITVFALQSWEQGRRGPAALTIPSLAAALGVTADELLAIPTDAPSAETVTSRPRGRPRKTLAVEADAVVQPKEEVKPKKPGKKKGK